MANNNWIGSRHSSKAAGLGAGLTGLHIAGRPFILSAVNTTLPPPVDEAARQRRLELARRAFHDFKAQCFWSWVDEPVITEETIPALIRELRHYGGAKGYQAVAEICR